MFVKEIPFNISTLHPSLLLIERRHIFQFASIRDFLHLNPTHRFKEKNGLRGTNQEKSEYFFGKYIYSFFITIF